MFTTDRRTNKDISFHEDEVKLARIMMDNLRTTVEFLYYLMESRGELGFNILMISADHPKLDSLLQKSKRKTDVLIEIDQVKKIYVIICQCTSLEGGKKFAEILISNIKLHGGSNVYCVETRIENTKDTIQDIIFRMVETYITIKQENKTNEVFFTKSSKDIT